MTLPEILTPRELGDYLRLSDATIRNMARNGDLPEAFRVGASWRIHRSAVQRLAPKPVTLPAAWQEADAPRSESTNAAPTGGASSGANTAPNEKSAGSRQKTKRQTAPTRSVSAFARDFPEYAKHERSAS